MTLVVVGAKHTRLPLMEFNINPHILKPKDIRNPCERQVQGITAILAIEPTKYKVNGAANGYEWHLATPANVLRAITQQSIGNCGIAAGVRPTERQCIWSMCDL